MTRFKKVFSLIFDDFQWKLISLVLAALIWFVGMNMSNPPQNLSVSPRLQLANIEIMSRDNIIVLNEDALRDINVSVVVRAPRSDMDILRAAQSDPDRFSEIVEASVDFRAISTSTIRAADGYIVQSLRISPNLAHGFEHLSITPAYVDVYLDVLESRAVPVAIIQDGELPPGFVQQELTLALGNNDMVTVRGARSDIRNISQIRTYVDISGAFGDMQIPVPLVVLDRDGNDMTDRVHLSASETVANLRVYRYRSFDVVINPVGTPAHGFALSGIDFEATSVELVGRADVLDELEAIVAEVNLQGVAGTLRLMVDIEAALPPGVQLRQDEASSVEIVARIERIQEREFTIPRENVRSRGGVSLYQHVDEHVPIRINISGPQSLISALNESTMALDFDLRGLAPGVHTIPLEVELPRGLHIVGTPPSLRVQIHPPPPQGGGNEPPLPPSPPEIDPEPTPSPSPPPTNGDNDNGNDGDNSENGSTDTTDTNEEPYVEEPPYVNTDPD